MGVSKLQTLWQVWPEKSSSTRLDPVYQFNYIFTKVEAKLYGENVNICWDKDQTSPLNSTEKGKVFLNYSKSEDGALEISSNCGDPMSSNSKDLKEAGCEDLSDN